MLKAETQSMKWPEGNHCHEATEVKQTTNVELHIYETVGGD